MKKNERIYITKAWFGRRTSHELNRMVMRENKGIFAFAFAFDLAHMKYGCSCCSADARYRFAHNFLITTAFISETCDSSLTSIKQKVFFTCNLESSEPGFVVARGRDCELPRQVSRRKQYSQTPFWAVLIEYPLASYTAASLGLCLCLCYTQFTHLF